MSLNDRLKELGVTDELLERNFNLFKKADENIKKQISESYDELIDKDIDTTIRNMMAIPDGISLEEFFQIAIPVMEKLTIEDINNCEIITNLEERKNKNKESISKIKQEN